MCGICGVYILGHDNLPDIATALNANGLDGNKLVENDASAAGILFLLLKWLNHRGPHSSGMVTSDGKKMYSHKEMGFAVDIFYQEILESLKGRIGIGNDRYATTGGILTENIQPFSLEQIALAHNGNLINERDLRRRIEAEERELFGYERLTSTTDSELMLHRLLIEQTRNPNKKLEKLIGAAYSGILGAYSNTIIIGNELVGIKGPSGTWKLNVAKLGDLVLFATEPIAIRKFVEAARYELIPTTDYIREMDAGEIIVVAPPGPRRYLGCLPKQPERKCSFDESYLSSHEDEKTMQFRKMIGGFLWERFEVNANYIVPVQNSGIYYAQGLMEKSGIPINGELIGISEEYTKSPKRTFMGATQQLREKGAKDKYVFGKNEDYAGKRIILVDDSIVRSTTMRYLITELRKRGVAELHVRLGTPPSKTPCYYGIHTPTKKELIANVLVTEDRVEKYFESIFYGVDYEKHKLVQLIKGGKTIEQIVEKSVQEGKNFLEDPQMMVVQQGKFSLRYLPMADYRRAFKETGFEPDKRCYACMIPNGEGYPTKDRGVLLRMGRI